MADDCSEHNMQQIESAAFGRKALCKSHLEKPPDTIPEINQDSVHKPGMVTTEEGREVFRKEWMILAVVLDRFFFICFFSATVLTILVIMLDHP